jgi:hypothetical protein
VAGPVAAKPPSPVFTGCEYDTNTFEEGDWKYAGPNMLLRARIHPFYDVVPGKSRVTGLVTPIVNGNFNAETFIGTAWGTFTTEPDEALGGSWEGTWVGPDNQPEIRLVGHGRGAFKGLELRETLAWDEESLEKCQSQAPPDPTYTLFAYIEGYIIEHGK